MNVSIYFHFLVFRNDCMPRTSERSFTKTVIFILSVSEQYVISVLAIGTHVIFINWIAIVVLQVWHLFTNDKYRRCLVLWDDCQSRKHLNSIVVLWKMQHLRPQERLRIYQLSQDCIQCCCIQVTNGGTAGAPRGGGDRRCSWHSKTRSAVSRCSCDPRWAFCKTYMLLIYNYPVPSQNNRCQAFWVNSKDTSCLVNKRSNWT